MMELFEAWWFRAAALLFLLGGSLYLVQKRIAHYRRRQSQQESFSRSLLVSQENERKRIAAELHDGLGQNLLLIKNRAMLVLEGPQENLDVHFQLQEISRVASQSIQEIREIARNLRPYQLDRLGLTKALQAAVRDASQSCSIQLSHKIESSDGIFSPEVEINLYRIVQEGLNNVLKHSGATRAKVLFMRQERGHLLVIQDDGRGFEQGESAEQSEVSQGLGFSGMRERARIMNGKLEVQSAPGQGTRIELRIPWKKDRQWKQAPAS